MINDDTYGCCPVPADYSALVVADYTACKMIMTDDGASGYAYATNAFYVSMTGVTTPNWITSGNYGTSSYFVDFLLAATYQKNKAAGVGVVRDLVTDWCDNQWTLLSAATVSLVTGGTAFTHSTKCTYFLHTDTAIPATAMAPAFMLTSSVSSAAEWYDFDLHYVEYVQVGGDMTPITGDAGATNAYPDGATAFYPDLTNNYIASSSNSDNANGNIETVMPGTFQCGLSDLQFSMITMDSYTAFVPADWDCTTIQREQREYRNVYNQYLQQAVDFNANKTIYETQVDAEEARFAAFDSGFTTEIMVPQKPAAPCMPTAYDGPYLVWDATEVAVVRAAALTINDNIGAYDGTASKLDAIGWLAVSNTDGTSNQYTGHIFGLLGQGEATMPNSTNPLAINVGVSDIAKFSDTQLQAFMMVSIFPKY
jgi:hypothetical protein